MLVGDGLSAAREGAMRTGEGAHRSLSWAAFICLAVLLALASGGVVALGPIMRVRGRRPSAGLS